MGVLIKMEKQQLEKYIEEYGRDIYLFCKRLTGNKSTADDLYQETFLKLWELDNVNDAENPKSYLLGIAANLWKNQYRPQCSGMANIHLSRPSISWHTFFLSDSR